MQKLPFRRNIYPYVVSGQNHSVTKLTYKIQSLNFDRILTENVYQQMGMKTYLFHGKKMVPCMNSEQLVY